jgi:hypothetical protein
MAGLPVNYCLSPIAVCNNRFHPQCDYRQLLPSRRTLGLRGFALTSAYAHLSLLIQQMNQAVPQ